MAIIPNHIFDLLIKEFTEGLNDEEALLLKQWLSESDENRKSYRELQELWLSANLAGLKKSKTEAAAWKAISSRVNARKTKRLNWMSFAAAASVVLVVGAYFAISQLFPSQDKQWVALSEQAKPAELVRLILPSGTEMALEDSLEGEMNVEGEFVYKDLSGISYQEPLKSESNEKAVIHELVVPQGGHYVLTLADGTIVTLNSESSIKFPTQFNDSVREVWMEGEAYFDVEHNPEKPFLVHASGMTTRVLGTQFDVRAYEEDADQSVTLVEGSVQLETAENKVRLKPGEQYYQDSKNLTAGKVRQVDTYLYTSWIDGTMYFDDITLGELIVRLNRWYDFKYEFKDESLKQRRFTGGVKKSDDLKTVFSLIGMVNDVSFQVERGQIIIEKKEAGK